LSELPLSLNLPPSVLMKQIDGHRAVCIAEEHVERGSFAAEFALHLLREGTNARIRHLCARAHHYPRYGSQAYLRKQSGLDPQSLINAIDTFQQRS
jgi:transketolase